MVDTYNPSILEMKAGGSEAQNHPQLHGGVEASLSYVVKSRPASVTRGPVLVNLTRKHACGALSGIVVGTGGPSSL